MDGIGGVGAAPLVAATCGRKLREGQWAVRWIRSVQLGHELGFVGFVWAWAKSRMLDFGKL